MMLADPGRMHAELVGVQRFGGDIGHELIGVARIVFVVIVAQREITELHGALLWAGKRSAHARVAATAATLFSKKPASESRPLRPRGVPCACPGTAARPRA